MAKWQYRRVERWDIYGLVGVAYQLWGPMSEEGMGDVQCAGLLVASDEVIDDASTAQFLCAKYSKQRRVVCAHVNNCLQAPRSAAVGGGV